MALGHNYTALVRVTPSAGLPYVVNLSTMSWMTICQPGWELKQNVKEFITRAVGKSKYGHGYSVHMEFELMTPSADETTLANLVVSPACDPDNDSTLELSLDNGTTYRSAIVTSFVQEPIEGKNIGVHIVLDWMMVSPATTKIAVGSGAF